MKSKSSFLKTLGAFREATMELDNVYSMFSKSCGLSEAEYWSLLLVYEGAATQSQISDQLFLSRQTLNSAFKQLRKKGLVRLEPYAENQRSKQVFLTGEGKAFVERHVVKMHRVEASSSRRMDEQERDMLIKLTRKYSALIREELNTAKLKTL